MRNLLLFGMGICTLLINACKKGESAQETITTMEVHLTGIGTVLDRKFYWTDTDGDGGAAPVIDTIKIPAGGTYLVHLHLFDRSQTPELDITEEIEAESNEHVFTYVFTNLDGKLAVSNYDNDENGLPLRLTSNWMTTDKGKGSVKIALYHEPTDKNNATDPGGSVDFEAEFPISIE